jgi:hypothetical protein
MAAYRFYVLGSDGHVVAPPKVVECPDDVAAIQQGRRYLDGKAIEVWQEARLIVKLEPDE